MKLINVRYIGKIIGGLLIIESLFMLVPLGVSIFYQETEMRWLSLSVGITLFCGLFLFMLSKPNLLRRIGKRDSYLLVSLAWIVLPLFGAIPFYLSGSIPNLIDAIFESYSGFTTTGSSILNDIESLSKGILFWRSETHWIGGMGIVVLVVALFPLSKNKGAMIFYTETSFFYAEKIRPRIIDTAKRVVFIYVSLTLLETLLLRLGDMNWFDSICHSFATIATGGFSTKNSSIAGYGPYIQYVIMGFMFLSGINFFLYYFLFTGKIKKVFKNQEFRLFSIIIFLSSVFIAVYLILNSGYQIEPALRLSFFQVISVVSCTGFATADYLQWPQPLWMLLFLLMFVGASAGSTGGGIKVLRHLIFLKKFKILFKQLLHPSSVQRIFYNGRPVSEGVIESVSAFVYLYILTFVLGTLFMMILGEDISTSMGAVATSLGGIGPGLGSVGPASNFSQISDLGKVFLPFLMVAGRLELISLFILFVPSFWRR